MRHLINAQDRELIERSITNFEEKTGCEMLLIVTDTCDDYPAASLRFGLFATLAVTLILSYFLEFHHGFIWPILFFVFALLFSWLGQFDSFKRFGLSDVEVERECREKSIELFHTLGSSKVSHKVTAMLLISELERKFEILVDETLREKISDKDLGDLVNVIQKNFQAHEPAKGIIESLSLFEEKILSAFGEKVSSATPNELQNQIIFLRQDRYDRPL
jgi:uncharacterized membrane protein